jgi:hypothetical protein
VTQPIVDMVTDSAIVILQDRPVVPFTTWISDTLQMSGDSGRGLQIVTPSTSRITMPLRLMLTGPNSRWVVREPRSGEYYDGLGGVRLVWDGAAFVPADPDDESLVPAFGLADPPDSSQLTLTFRVTNPATAQMQLGGSLERLCQALSDEPPRGWGTCEPIGQPWRRTDLTELARRRMPEPTWMFTIAGSERPAIASIRVSRSSSGVEEWGTLVVGYGPDDEPPVIALPDIAGALAAEFQVVSMFAQMRSGRGDLTSPAHWEGLPAPVGMVVGPEGVNDAGLDRALNPPGGVARQLPSPAGPTVWYTLGDGRSSDGWTLFEKIMRHMRHGSQRDRVG